ncbi:hypothetical protein LWI29_034531 [Acer saccharum]|uniref:UBN2_3 domain-containing protein n=1 Tax=Acer saccharum TaxID=4024 RepID=A0AA39SFQ1_ACESA|nr:hypothetical protein LWI29_034531 [Acer saccharum]
MIWKNQLLNVVIANGLEDFIYGTLPCPQKFQDPAQTIVNPQHGQWQRLNRLVMSWIYSSTSEGLMGQIVGHSTAYDIWAALQKLYESTSTARIMGMRSQLQKIKKEGISLTQYLAQMKEITNKFAAIGELLSYRDHLGYLLEGLGAEYNSFVTSIHNRTDQPSIENVHSLLMSYEYKLEKQNSIDQLNFAQANLLSFQENKKFQKPFQTNVQKSQPYHSSFPNTSTPKPQMPFSNTQTSILGKPQGQPYPSKWPQRPNFQTTKNLNVRYVANMVILL